jgi:hypothetical protein
MQLSNTHTQDHSTASEPYSSNDGTEGKTSTKVDSVESELAKKNRVRRGQYRQNKERNALYMQVHGAVN